MNSIFHHLQNIAKSKYDKQIMEEFYKFGNSLDQTNIEKLALDTQIVIKKSEPNYNHGFLIFAALAQTITTSSQDDQMTLMDIGTARGFSALVMALVAKKYNNKGTILSIDRIPHEEVRKWKCILDGKSGISRLDIVNRYDEAKNIIFLNGKSSKVMRNIHTSRINFAFIDGDHRWKSLKHEVEYLESRQITNDKLLFDDYTPKVYPDVVRAVDSLAKKYEIETFGDSSRGYALLTRI